MPVVAAFVVLVDQFTKYLVMARLGTGQFWEIAPWLAPVFRFTHVTNTGAAFGLFREWGDFFVVVAAIVVVVIIFYYHHLPDGQRLMRVALGLQSRSPWNRAVNGWTGSFRRTCGTSAGRWSSG